LLDRCKVHSRKPVRVGVGVGVGVKAKVGDYRQNKREWRMENGEPVLLPCSSKEESLEFGVWRLEVGVSLER
jgi:hypothetical protein